MPDLQKSIFLEWQSCHLVFTVIIIPWPFICQFSICLFIKTQICICLNGPGCHPHCLLFLRQFYLYDMAQIESTFFFEL